jgi:hypothetical protein
MLSFRILPCWDLQKIWVDFVKIPELHDLPEWVRHIITRNGGDDPGAKVDTAPELDGSYTLKVHLFNEVPPEYPERPPSVCRLINPDVKSDPQLAP